MKKEIPRFIRYSRLSHACFVICIILGLGAIKIGGFVLFFMGWVLIIYSLAMDQLIFRKFGIGFYYGKHYPMKGIPDNQAIDVKWEFVEEENHVKIERT